MGYQSVSWWRQHGRRFNVPANSLKVPKGKTVPDYTRHQTHPVLAVDHGHGPWKISDGEHTIRSRQGQNVWGCVVPVKAFSRPGANGCLGLTLVFTLVPAAAAATTLIRSHR